jgi:hypothetical protein
VRNNQDQSYGNVNNANTGYQRVSNTVATVDKTEVKNLQNQVRDLQNTV